MNRQLVTGTLVALAVAALVGWTANNTRWEEVIVPARLTGEAARNPFYTAERLTEELGATSEWRRTLGELPEPDAVVMLTSWHWDLIDGRRTRLEQWVESGGRLVILGNLSGGEEALQEWTGLSKEYPERAEGDADAAGDDPESGMVIIGGGIPACATLRIATGRSHANASRDQYDVCGFGAGRLTSSSDPEWSAVERMKASDGARKHEDWPQAVRVAAGRGSVTWVNAAPSWIQAGSPQLSPELSPQPFGNRGLLQKDHGVLFVDALQLDRDDHVVFLSEEESASLLELIWTYGSPVVLLALLLIVLAVWRDAARFGPLAAPLELSRRSLAEQIRGTAQFARRVGAAQGLHAAMVRALHEAARLRIPGYERLRERDRIPAIAELAGLDSDKLFDAIHSDRQDAHEFRDSVALLDAARRNLVASRTADRRRRLRRRPEKRSAAEAFDPVEL